MCAVSLRAALTLNAVRVLSTCFIAIQEMSACILETASRIAFKIVVASILSDLLPVQALRWMDTAVV